METTQKIAKLLLKIKCQIDPYEICSLDKKDILNEVMSISVEDNLGHLTNYINTMYESVQDLLEDRELIKLIARLYKEISVQP